MTRGTFEMGGIHPPENKEKTESLAIVAARLPERVVIPMAMHLGAPAKPIVAVGDLVKKGQKVGEAQGHVSAPVHASISGKVTAVGNFPSPMGIDVPAVVIESDGLDEWVDGLVEHEDFMSLSAGDLRAIIKDAGIVGMGGATFPSHVKLDPPKEKKITAVILNGAECEPYLTSDSRLMEENPSEIVEGIKIMMNVLKVTEGFIGIEKNKPAAIEKITEEAGKVACEIMVETHYHRDGMVEDVAAGCKMGVHVLPLEVKYPQGSEKQLIKAVTGREVPPGLLPMDVGAVVQNVSTAAAVYEAVRFGRPLIDRVVTITGPGIKEPKNMRVRIGTLFSEVIEQCGGLTDEASKVLMGGPMMGIAQADTMVPVIKGTSGIVALTGEDAAIFDIGPCIRCGRCVEVCPMGLNPGLLGRLIETGRFEEAKEHGLMDCFECGSCSYVCPSSRPMVQFAKWAKRELAKKKK
ncbi:MAG TPA: electron transport complex subunit RsxC [Nitrospirota bacterium]